MSYRFVVCTFPDADVARRVTRQLVEEQLAACGNLLPGAESIYRWKGAVETASEVVVFYKTTEAGYPALEARLKALHPYEVPEILALPIEAGFPGYLRWVAENVKA